MLISMKKNLILNEKAIIINDRDYQKSSKRLLRKRFVKKFKKKGMIIMVLIKRIFLTVIALFFLLMAISGCSPGENSPESGIDTPEGAAFAYYNALKQKDFSKAFSLNWSFKDISEEQLKQVEPLLATFDVIEFSIGESERISDDEYVYQVNVRSSYQGQESVADIKTKMIRVDGNWYIDESQDKGDGETVFGEPVDRDKYEEVEVSDLLNDPRKYSGKKIIIRAEKGASCGGGCHFNISDGENTIFVASNFQTFTPHGTPVIILGELRARPGQDPYIVVLGLEVI